MAKVHPTMDELRHLPVPLLPGELQVLDTLRARRRLVHLRPAAGPGLDQPDFVVVHAEHGVVVIEVRDWRPGMYRRSPAGPIEVQAVAGWERTDEVPRYLAHRSAVVVQERFFADTNDPPRDPSVPDRCWCSCANRTRRSGRSWAARATPSELRVRCLSGARLRVSTVVELVGPPIVRRRAVSARNLTRLARHLDQPDDRPVDAPLAPGPTDLDGLAEGGAAPAGRHPSRAGCGRLGKTTGLVGRAASSLSPPGAPSSWPPVPRTTRGTCTGRSWSGAESWAPTRDASRAPTSSVSARSR